VNPIALAELEWPPWQRLLWVRAGTTAWTRRATVDGEPLVVRLPPNWTVVGGMGAYDAPGSDSSVARSVNDDWVVMESKVDEVFEVMVPKFKALLNYAPERTMRLLRGLPLVEGILRRSAGRGARSPSARVDG
jgi:hypothetical protein